MNLKELILAAKGANSYEQLSKLCGGKPTAGRLQQLATKSLQNFPDPDSIHSMARGFGVSEKSIVLAAAVSLGLDVETGQSRLETLLPPSAASLTDEQIQLVIGMIRSYALLPREADATVTTLRPEPDDDGADPDAAYREKWAAEDAPIAAREGTPREHDANAGEQNRG